MLRIRNLMLEDTGNFTVHVKHETGDVSDKTFRLVVYGEAPAPRILPSNLSISPKGCNVTLQCQVTGTKGVNISWEGRPYWGLSQQSNNGTYLHLFLWGNYSDSTINCSSSNPADKKVASIKLFNICSNASQTWRYHLLVLLLIPIVAAAGLGSWMWKKKSRKKSAITAFNFKKNKEINTPETLYENIGQKRLHTGDQTQAKDRSPPEVIYENIGEISAGEQYQHQPFAGTMVNVPPPLYNQVVLPR
nr:PREDICTED: T-lymphocyte surface antigen Ly-9 [Anolis carolinensis]|eukprot:XP_008123079.1 PREDICTED: T-lymphocyte surface antigen Ly-9 [Anolis carolinensis]